MNKNKKAVACKKCGWIHFEVSLEYVLDWQDGWIDFWIRSSKEDMSMFGCEERPPSYKSEFLSCSRCGNSHKNFISIKKKEIPIGVTIGPILQRKAF